MQSRTLIGFVLILGLMVLAGCESGTTTPYVPTDPPTQQELANLLGDWEGLTETSTGLLDQINLTFYTTTNDNVAVTIYLNDTYVDDVGVNYDGDRIRFASFSITGEYGEFDCIINHASFVLTGVFSYTSGISYREGTLVAHKINPGTTPDPPTQQELDDLVGDWDGLIETLTGSIDQLGLTFYVSNENVVVTIYLNDEYVDNVYVQYDGDRVWFASYNFSDEYAEFEGDIDHVDLNINGTFFIQTLNDYDEGSFEVSKT